MPYQPIENYGIIGNMRTVALVGMNGSIDWYCYPHFDSASIFGAILDDKRGGRFRISPIAEDVRYKQFYFPSTNILITRFLLADGIVELEDFMPVGLPSNSPWYHRLFRRVRCVRGTVHMSLICHPAFDYGRKVHEVALQRAGVLFKSGELGLILSTALPLKHGEHGSVTCEFLLKEGQSEAFLLSAQVGDAPVSCTPPQEQEAEEVFQLTVNFWQRWLSACTYRGRWREHVQRSALALKLLTFEPTGAIVAAPTTSIPEVVGGTRNWDYRYTWLRDAAFTIYGFLRIGFREEATGFMNWIENYASKHIDPKLPLPVLFTIHGDKEVGEYVLDHWEGYGASRPVRIGNAASSQLQLDLYGEVMDGFYLYNKYVSPISYETWVKLRNRLNWICEHWQSPDAGIWEMRNREEHFVYSKVMNWVALDRGY